MRKFLIGAALATAASGLAAPATAAITFNLSNVVLVDGGTLTGFLTTSDDLLTLIDFNITSTTMSSVYGSFTGRTYSFSSAASVSWVWAQGINANFASPAATLHIFFASPLATSGAALAITASETQSVAGGGTRYAVAGEVLPAPAVTVPEPASWALMIGGFALAGATLRRRGLARGAVA